jgi:serine/threonine-protein kinase
MLDLTAEQFAQRAFDLNLIDQRQLESVWSTCGTRNVPPDEFQNLLVRRELLTNYQVERLLKGEKAGFFYGDYKVLYLVGTGSFARVYRAAHIDSGRVVAVKVLRKRYNDNPIETERFLREGELGSHLVHPNIVPIISVHSQHRTHFLVMDFVEGQSLREFLKIRRQLSAEEASEIMIGVMSGLAYAAEKGITHRDLKLSNVLISSDGRPQIVDFGLAAMVTGPGEGGFSNSRTIDYAGLEKATGVRKDDPRSDIYFAGCMYYQMLTGIPPLPDTRDRFQRMNMGRFREVKPIRGHLPDIPPAVETVVRKAMTLDLKERYAKPVEMMVDLQKAKNAAVAATAHAAHVEEEEISTGPSDTHTIMLVDSNEAIQNAVRSGLKKHGYKVLVIGDVQRAQNRLTKDTTAADCVIVSVASLGRAALSLLGKLRKNRATAKLPVILIFGKSQTRAKEQLKLDEQSVGLLMPLRISEVREQLMRLLKTASVED